MSEGARQAQRHRCSQGAGRLPRFEPAVEATMTTPPTDNMSWTRRLILAAVTGLISGAIRAAVEVLLHR